MPSSAHADNRARGPCEASRRGDVGRVRGNARSRPEPGRPGRCARAGPRRSRRRSGVEQYGRARGEVVEKCGFRVTGGYLLPPCRQWLGVAKSRPGVLEMPRASEKSAEHPSHRLRSASVKRRLLAWFAAHGRDLPWRRTRDPYAILVSEVMLQQTQVERVVPRYLAWLERWPTVEALAAATAADVDPRRGRGSGTTGARSTSTGRRRRIAERRLAGRPDRASRRRALHGGRGRQLRARRARPPGGHERRAACRSARGTGSGRSAGRRSWTSARPSVSPASLAAACARSPRRAPHAAGATSRRGGRGRFEGSFRQRRARTLRARRRRRRARRRARPRGGRRRSSATGSYASWTGAVRAAG